MSQYECKYRKFQIVKKKGLEPLLVIDVVARDHDHENWYYVIKTLPYRKEFGVEEHDCILSAGEKADNVLAIWKLQSEIFVTEWHEDSLHRFTTEDMHQWRGTWLGEQTGIL